MRKKGEATIEEKIASKPGYLPEEQRPCCLRCKKRLKPMPMALCSGHSDLYYPTPYADEAERADRIDYGYDGNNYFCTQRCGYLYGLAVARSAERQRRMFVGAAGQATRKEGDS